jgi:hypothetical protein
MAPWSKALKILGNAKMGPRFLKLLEAYIFAFLSSVLSCLGYAMQQIAPSSKSPTEYWRIHTFGINY